MKLGEARGVVVTTFGGVGTVTSGSPGASAPSAASAPGAAASAPVSAAASAAVSGSAPASLPHAPATASATAPASAPATPVTSDEWVVPVGDSRVGFWTPNLTPWLERLAASNVVTVQAADSFGHALREEPLFEGRAVTLRSGDEFASVKAATHQKYALGVAVAGAVDWLSEIGGDHTPEGVVIITIVG